MQEEIKSSQGNLLSMGISNNYKSDVSMTFIGFQKTLIWNNDIGDATSLHVLGEDIFTGVSS